MADLNVSLPASGELTLYPDEFIAFVDGTCPPFQSFFRLPNGDLVDEIDVTCEDLGVTMITIEVQDASGGSNSCLSNLNIEDKILPELNCPDNIVLFCDQDPYDTSVTGFPTVGGGCGNYDITFEDEVQFGDCGPFIRRTFSAVNGDVISSCTQLIAISGPSPSYESSIVWPDSFVATCEELEDGSLDPENLPLNRGFPILPDTECQTAIDFIEILVSDFSCNIQLVRVWEVGGPCFSQPYTYSQVIDIIDNESPVIENCDEFSFVGNNDCERGLYNKTLIASDNCDSALDYSYEVDVFSDGTVDFFQPYNTINFSFPQGGHTVRWTVNDDCGNTTVCEEYVVSGPPVPICNSALNVSLGVNGTAVLLPEIIDEGSFSFCNQVAEYRLRIADGSQSVPLASSLVLTCADIGTFDVEMWVGDFNNAWDYCITTITVEDKLGVCGASARSKVGGRSEEVSEFQVYPNPAAGPLNIECHIHDAETARLQILDLTGKLLSTHRFNENGNQIILMDDLPSSLTSGLIMVKLFDGVEWKSEKVMIVR